MHKDTQSFLRCLEKPETCSNSTPNLFVCSVVEALLTYCASNEIEYRRSIGKQSVIVGERHKIREARVLRKLALEMNSSRIKQPVWNVLRGLLFSTNGSDDIPLVAKARAAAIGLSEMLRIEHFIEFWKFSLDDENIRYPTKQDQMHPDEIEVRVRRGMLIPIPRNDNSTIMRTGSGHGPLAFRVGQCDNYLFHLPTARLVDREPSVELWLNFELFETFDPFVDQTGNLVAFACLGTPDVKDLFVAEEPPDGQYAITTEHLMDLEEEHRKDIDEERESISALGLFGGVCPKSKVRDTFTKIIEKATLRKAKICIFPELSLDLEQLDESQILEMIRNSDTVRDSPLQLIVAGTSHKVIDDAETRNRLFAFFRVGEEWILHTHDKVCQYSYSEKSEQSCIKYIENITSPASLKIYFGRSHSFCFLVCKDLLDHAVVETLAKAGVSFVLVAALSSSTKEFENRLRELLVYSNTVSLLVCTTSVPYAEAIVCLPRPEAVFRRTKKPSYYKSQLRVEVFDVGTSSWV